MSDHNNNAHGQHSGGHEVDSPPTRELFNIIWGLSALTLLSLVTCVQLFNNQARDLNTERGKEGSYVLQDYRKDQETRTRGSGQDSVTDATGKVVARYNYIPLASARELVLSKPEKLGAFPPPAGWVHPDDIASGGQGGAPPVPPPAPAPTDGAPAPTDGAAVPVPADGQPAPAPTDGAAGTPPTGTTATGTTAATGTPPVGTTVTGTTVTGTTATGTTAAPAPANGGPAPQPATAPTPTPAPPAK